MIFDPRALGVVVALSASIAHAGQRVVVSDIEGESEEAGAISLLVRGHLTGGARPVVPRGEMELALKRVEVARRGSGLMVDPAGAAALLSDLGADRLIAGDLIRDDLHLSLTLRVYDTSGALIGASSVRAARGEVAALASEGLKRIAGEAGVEVTARPAVSLGELRPFVRATQALAAGKPADAASALQLADRNVAGRAPGAKEVADQVWRDDKLNTDGRIGAALAAGEVKAAVKIGEGVRAPDVPTRAGLARAQLADSDVRHAEKTLAPVKKENTSAALALARAELSFAKGKVGDAESQLKPLLDKTPPDPAALAFIASQRPKAFSPGTELAAIVAAQRLAKQHPGVASSIGVRSTRAGGLPSADALGLLSIDDLSPGEANELSGVIEGAPSAKSLQEGLNARKKDAKPVALPGTPGSTVARMVGKDGKIGGGAAKPVKKRAVAEVTAEMKQIASQLGPLLESFPQLAERRPGTLVVYGFDNQGGPPWAIWSASHLPVRYALMHALESPPYELGVIEGNRAVGELSHDQLAKLARAPGFSGDYLMLYRVTPEGSLPHLYLSLYDVAAGQAFEYEDTLQSGAGVMRINLVLLPLAGLLVLIAFGTIYLRLMRTGALRVELKKDTGSEQEAIVILVSKKDKPPAIKNAQEFHEKYLNQTTKVGRLKVTMPQLRTELSRVPLGTWWVHVYGTCVKGGELRYLPAGLSQRVTVKKKALATAKFDLDPNATEYRVSVTDGSEAVKGAVVYTENNPNLRCTTDGLGQGVLMLARGEWKLVCEVKDERFERTISSTGAKVQALQFDLERERRQRELAQGIAIVQDEQHAPYHPPAAADDEGGTAPAAAAAKPSDPEDDGVSLPAGFHIPIPTSVEPQTRAEGLAGTVAAVASARHLKSESPAPSSGVASGSGPTGMRRYRRVSELGRGAMGVVYKGRDVVLDRDVAIKLIGDEVKSNPQALDMFFQEAKAMAALNHPNLVTVYDQGQDGSETYLVMELIDGQTLESLLQERGGALPVPEALHVAEQMAAGLAYAHGRRILHRDIKPANIFLTKDGVVKIGDFGLARAVRQARLTQTKVCGTPLYMSPEQIRGTDVDFRADLYSVGCTLFELLCGQPPFVTGEVLYHHMYTQPPKLSDVNPQVPPDVEKLILALLEKDLKVRTESAESLRKSLKPLKARYTG